MTDSRLAKRPRLNEASYIRSKDFWIADGSVVLVAQKDAFRVHQSILSRKSSVFAQMFADTPPENSETYQDVPVVHVSDARQDMRELLTVFYDGDKLLNTTILTVAPLVLSAWLRLGIKYQLDHLRYRVITMLQERYPDTLKGHDEWTSKSSGITHSSWSEGRGDIIFLNLARKFDLHTLLPGIFLACSQLRVDHLVVDPYPGDAKRMMILSASDLRRCIEGRELLLAFHMKRFDFVFQPDIPTGCESALTCKEKLKSIRDFTWENDGLLDHHAPLRKFEFICRNGFCSYCEEFYTEMDERAREQQWGELKSVFNLDQNSE
ncbi:hypothetical protein EIP91_007801 [Steccherinum ochraceum]|uniref:BTB domain-containing protein n=1 Tax=Steccherinum ochraceum TaxID=92696 RepID=A0A4R0R6F6_9APHY|nr:hypothetical protein EIP91_007801 [Steccherinum ochraceum]